MSSSARTRRRPKPPSGTSPGGRGAASCSRRRSGARRAVSGPWPTGSGVDRTVMTYLLDDLERAGPVERRPDPSDRRSRHVVATEHGGQRWAELSRRVSLDGRFDAEQRADGRAEHGRIPLDPRRCPRISAGSPWPCADGRIPLPARSSSAGMTGGTLPASRPGEHPLRRTIR
ncbi:MarR family transcriptional regulator [Streptomyces sp. NPDC002309]